MAMMRLRDIAAHFRRSELAVKFSVERETRLLVEEAAIEAKALIGHELEEWPPLAPSTIAEKRRLGFTGQVSETDPLLRTAQLRDSISADAEATPSGAIGMVGSDDPASVFQEFGTSRIPPRPFIGPTGISIVARAVPAFGSMAIRALTPGERP